MTEIEQALIAVRDVFVNYPKRLTELQEQLKENELEIQDLLHIIELHAFSASKGYQLAKELKEARNKRRTLKDEIEFLEIVKSKLLSGAKPAEKQLNNAISEIRKKKTSRKNRTYSMRVRKDLQEMIK